MVARKVDNMMKDRSDYKSFYYRPISANLYKVSKESIEHTETEGYN